MDTETGPTLNQLLDRWLEVVELEPTTRSGYVRKLDKHVRPVLGAVQVGRLDAETLESSYALLRRCRDRCDGRRQDRHRIKRKHECDNRCEVHVCRPLAPATVRQIHAILGAALARAVRWRWLAVNPTAQAVAPAAPKPDPQPPSTEEAARIVVEAPNSYGDEVEGIVQGFEYELCSDCGGDLGDHIIAPDPLGHAHAWCQRERDPSDHARGAEDTADGTDGWRPGAVIDENTPAAAATVPRALEAAGLSPGDQVTVRDSIHGTWAGTVTGGDYVNDLNGVNPRRRRPRTVPVRQGDHPTRRCHQHPDHR